MQANVPEWSTRFLLDGEGNGESKLHYMLVGPEPGPVPGVLCGLNISDKLGYSACLLCYQVQTVKWHFHAATSIYEAVNEETRDTVMSTFGSSLVCFCLPQLPGQLWDIFQQSGEWCARENKCVCTRACSCLLEFACACSYANAYARVFIYLYFKNAESVCLCFENCHFPGGRACLFILLYMYICLCASLLPSSLPCSLVHALTHRQTAQRTLTHTPPHLSPSRTYPTLHLLQQTIN